MRDVAMAQSDIAAVERTQANKVLQGALGIIVLGGKHETGRVAVEPMHYAGTVLALQGAQMLDAAVVDQSVCERARVMPVSRMAHQAALF